MPTCEGQCRTGGPLTVKGIDPPAKPVIHHSPTPFTRLATAPPTDADMRAWATRAGIDCPRGGRVPKRVREAYERAHR